MLSKTILKMKELEFEDKTEDIQDESDSDDCDYEEINRTFVNSLHICDVPITNKEYILHISASNDSNPNIVLALSNNKCEVVKLSDNQVSKLLTFSEHTDKIIDCRFNYHNGNLIYSGSSDGTIKLWDIRTPNKSVINFEDTTIVKGETHKDFSCFDISSCDRLLAVGTDVLNGDAYILFWDIRNKKLLGGYWDSHTDDITQVKFQPDDMNKLISGSVDGLINVYDLSQPTEDDALIDSLNTESSVEDLIWYNERCVSCITHTSDLQLWQLENAEPYKSFTRQEIAKLVKKGKGDFVYLGKSHQDKNGLLVLVGSNFKDGECLRGFSINKDSVQKFYGFKENTQRIRGSWYNENINLLLTGGEKGILDAWKLD